MTDDMMSLQASIENRPDVDFLREMIGVAAQRVTEPDVAELTGAGCCRCGTARTAVEGDDDRGSREGVGERMKEAETRILK